MSILTFKKKIESKIKDYEKFLISLYEEDIEISEHKNQEKLKQFEEKGEEDLEKEISKLKKRNDFEISNRKEKIRLEKENLLKKDLKSSLLEKTRYLSDEDFGKIFENSLKSSKKKLDIKIVCCSKINYDILRRAIRKTGMKIQIEIDENIESFILYNGDKTELINCSFENLIDDLFSKKNVKIEKEVSLS